MAFLSLSKNRVVYFHILYWIILVVFLTFVWGTYDGAYYRNMFIQLWSLPARLIATYVTIVYLFPRTYFRGKFLSFAGLFLVLISLTVLFVQRPIIVFIVEGLYLPYDSPSFLSVIPFVNTGIDICVGVVPILFLHQNLFVESDDIASETLLADQQKEEIPVAEEQSVKGEVPVKENPKETFLMLKEGRINKRVPHEKILFIESQKNLLITKTLTDEIRTYGNMYSLAEDLPSDTFIRIHRSYIVNIDKVDHYSTRFVNINGKDFPIGRHYKQQVIEVLDAKLAPSN